MNWSRVSFCFAAIVLLPIAGLAMKNESLSETLQKRSYREGDRIAIIGAGVCGLAVARSLVESGVAPEKIEVIEKSDQPGGKVHTVTVDGRPFELGAQIVVPGVYDPILKIVKKYGLSLRKPDGGANFNLQTGELEPKMSSKNEVKFLKEMAVYEHKYQTKWKSISEPLGLSHIPDALNMSWPDFVKEEGFQTIHEVSSGFVGGSGYLRADALPQPHRW